jgi:TIR domain
MGTSVPATLMAEHSQPANTKPLYCSKPHLKIANVEENTHTLIPMLPLGHGDACVVALRQCKGKKCERIKSGGKGSIFIGRRKARRTFSNMPNHVFISYAAQDRNKADEICAYLERSGVRCWIAPRDINPGSSWGDEIADAIRSSAAVLLLLSPLSNRSVQVTREVTLAVEQRLPVLPVLIETVKLSRQVSLQIGDVRSIDATNDRWLNGLTTVVQSLASLVPQIEQSGPPVLLQSHESSTKGYVFISYNSDNSDFVIRLKEILKRRKYAYWDYSESERNFHNALYKELEEKIENAKAFMSVVTDSWRESEWPAAEYIYAREAKIPVFVILAQKLTRPFPIIINQQTRIDMASDFERGALVLEHELDKKGL